MCITYRRDVPDLILTAAYSTYERTCNADIRNRVLLKLHIYPDLSQLKALDRPQDNPLPQDVSKRILHLGARRKHTDLRL